MMITYLIKNNEESELVVAGERGGREGGREGGRHTVNTKKATNDIEVL